jgi:transposase
MSRPPVFPAEDKIRIVLSVLSGEMTIAEAARRNKGLRAVGVAVEDPVPGGRPGRGRRGRQGGAVGSRGAACCRDRRVEGGVG